MSRSSPAVQRVVAVLNFFASHPAQAFTFTDIVNALKLGRATCHALLTGLVEEQYLYRNRDKTYVIGPALVAIGRVSQQQFSPLQAAESEIRALADKYHAVCSVIALEGNVAVVKSKAGAASDLGWSMLQQPRVPLRAASGAVFFAWSRESDVDAWLAELKPAATAEQREALLAGMAFTRQHGYAVGVVNVSGNPEFAEGRQPFGPANYPITVIAEMTPSADYQLAYVVAPVFDPSGNVAFILNLSGFSAKHSGDEIAEIGSDLVAACQRTTTFVSGADATW